MEATVRRGLKYCNQVYQPGEQVEGPIESLWPLALQGYVDLPDDFKSKLSDESKKELGPTKAPSGGTPRLPGDRVIPTPPPTLAQQPGHQQQGRQPGAQPQPQQSPPPPQPPPHPHEQGEARKRR
jgi:hypothetical protein